MEIGFGGRRQEGRRQANVLVERANVGEVKPPGGRCGPRFVLNIAPELFSSSRTRMGVTLHSIRLTAKLPAYISNP